MEWKNWVERYVRTIPKLLVTPANGAKIVSRNLKILTHVWHTCESHLLRVCCTLVYPYSSSHFTGWVDSGWDLSTANPFHHQPDFSKNDFDDDHHYQSSWLISSLPFDKRRPASQFTPFQTRPALQSPAWEAGGDGGGWSGWSWGWGLRWGGWSCSFQLRSAMSRATCIRLDHTNVKSMIIVSFVTPTVWRQMYVVQ